MRKLWQQTLLSLTLGAIAVFSFAPFHLWPIAFISFCGLLGLIANKSRREAMILSFCWGVGFFAAGVHWIYISIRQYGDLPALIALLILVLLILYLSLYPILFGVILRALNRYAPPFSFLQLMIVAPLIWQITEFLRGNIMNGFSWLQLGYPMLDSPLRGYFPLFGIDGVNLIFTILCGLTVYLLHGLVSQHISNTDKKDNVSFYRFIKHKFNALFALILLFFAPLLTTQHKWIQVNNQRAVTVALIQGNITQSLRWNSQQLYDTLDTYAKLTKVNFDKDIIIWPEAAITDIELNQQSYLQNLDEEARQNRSTVAVGLLDYRPKIGNFSEGDIYNSLIVLGDDKPYHYPTKNRYEKHHLVPFGEYTPFETLFKPIAQLLDIPMSSLSSGSSRQPPIVMHNLKFTTAICYEVILSHLMWQNFTSDTDFLLTVSNDAWFGNTVGPIQHLQMAQARALEFGRPLIRSTNNGITAIIDSKGNIINQLPQFETAVLSAQISPSTGLTPYARWGDLPYSIILSLMLLLLLIKAISQKISYRNGKSHF